MKAKIDRKSKALKTAIDRYNTYKRFVDSYNRTKKLDDYITYVQLSMATMSESTSKFYEKIINKHYNGDSAELVSTLFDRYIDAAEHKDKVSDELKDLLSELKHESKIK